MKTLSYINSTIEDIIVGKKYYFGQPWDGNGGDSQGNELLESRCIAIYDETNEEDKIVDFEITENDENILQTIVKVTFIS